MFLLFTLDHPGMVCQEEWNKKEKPLHLLFCFLASTTTNHGLCNYGSADGHLSELDLSIFLVCITGWLYMCKFDACGIGLNTCWIVIHYFSYVALISCSLSGNICFWATVSHHLFVCVCVLFWAIFWVKLVFLNIPFTVILRIAIYGCRKFLHVFLGSPAAGRCIYGRCYSLCVEKCDRCYCYGGRWNGHLRVDLCWANGRCYCHGGIWNGHLRVYLF